MTITLTREEAQKVLDALGDSIDAQQWELDDHITKFGEGYKPHRVKYMREQLANTNSTIETLRARFAQPEPEPVAWLHRFIEHGISIGKKPVDLDKYPDRWMPVYKDPTPCQTCEALARTVMMDQTSHDTPQREWQGLTNEEIHSIPMLNKRHYARAMEAKLKEKNT